MFLIIWARVRDGGGLGTDLLGRYVDLFWGKYGMSLGLVIEEVKVVAGVAWLVMAYMGEIRCCMYPGYPIGDIGGL